MSPGFPRANGCDLCRAARITPWYYEDEICWIAECEICEVPMVVWRYHGTTPPEDRKSTRLNSSHGYISYAVFCLKKKHKQRCSLAVHTNRAAPHRLLSSAR